MIDIFQLLSGNTYHVALIPEQTIPARESQVMEVEGWFHR